MITSMDHLTCPKCRELSSKLDDVEYEKDKLFIRKKELEKTICSLSSEIHSKNKELFESNEGLKKAHEELAKLDDLKREKLTWSQNLITIGEMYTKAKETLDAINSNQIVKANSKDSFTLRYEACKRDLEEKKALCDQRTRERDWYKAKLKETEESLNLSKQAVTDAERRIQEQAVDYKDILECKKQRIESLEKINEAFTQKILQLNRLLGKDAIDLPNMESLHIDSEQDLGESEEASDSVFHPNNHA